MDEKQTALFAYFAGFVLGELSSEAFCLRMARGSAPDFSAGRARRLFRDTAEERG